MSRTATELDAADGGLTPAAQQLGSARQVSGYLPTLDGWRAIAILAVMTFHVSARLFDRRGPSPNANLLYWTGFGAQGVNIFFSISGLLICSRLLDEETVRGRISLRGFYLRRFFRILPPYLAYLAALVVLVWLGQVKITSAEWPACLLFYRNYLPIAVVNGWYTGHFWSLAVEEHFYLLWPGLLVLCGRKAALPLAAVAAIGVSIWRLVDGQFHLLPVRLFSRTDIWMDYLLYGCVAALLLGNAKWRSIIEEFLHPLIWQGFLGLFVVFTVLDIPVRMAFQAALLPVVLAGTVLNPAGIAGRLLESAPLRWIGRMSYSLYIWQQLFLVAERGVYAGGQVQSLQKLPLSVIGAVACAIASYYLIERPMIKLGHRLAKPVTAGRKGTV